LVPKFRVSVPFVLGAAYCSAKASLAPLAWECLRHFDHSLALGNVALSGVQLYKSLATLSAFPDDACVAVLLSDVSAERSYCKEHYSSVALGASFTFYACSL
jgi:hypothetical protein